MKTSEILNKAAEIMMERGKATGHICAPDLSVCTLGAIEAAFISEVATHRRYSSYVKAQEAVASVIKAPRYRTGNVARRRVAYFNDVTANEAMALGALHEAAILAKEQGD